MYATLTKKDDMNMSEELKSNISIRMDRYKFYIHHKPSNIYTMCSVYNGPNALKSIIEEWVDSIDNPSADSPTD
jgi:hypothetical protein